MAQPSTERAEPLCLPLGPLNQDFDEHQDETQAPARVLEQPSEPRALTGHQPDKKNVTTLDKREEYSGGDITDRKETAPTMSLKRPRHWGWSVPRSALAEGEPASQL